MDWLSIFAPATLIAIGGVYYAWRALDQIAVTGSQEEFRAERIKMREHFSALCDLAANIHTAERSSLRRIGNSGMLIEDSMEALTPVPLSSVRVEWDDSEPPDNLELRKLARRMLPKRTRWKKFATYSAAMGSLAKPALFENQFCFRVVYANWRDVDGPKIILGRGRYFDLIDQAEALAHELSSATKNRASSPTWAQIPMRASLVRDPFSFESRIVLASIGTLTIRRTPDGRGTFFLLYRKAGRVATGEAAYNVLPGGMFQPASISPLGYRRDLSIWRNIMREYNEEMLGAPEAKGEGGMEVDYTEPPYSDFEEAVSAGDLRVWSFGVGLEAHNLTPCLLTVATFEANLFDRIFASLVEANDEGTVVSGPRHGGITGLPLREAEVNDLLGSSKLAPPAAALLYLALQYQDLLLAPPP
ncbi:hypothetical protein [Actinomadura sp. DC4]|uniref:hypothetical protein n=1 Tax=Actinomadura sp. DC4 TaxID=3055069 RepID=UPI0025B01CD6|nr:hypothetical protein [Actinomadura sp. DC4]MDN3354176.1 hypothetical protein [Actinomadura sp. DC4]